MRIALGIVTACLLLVGSSPSTARSADEAARAPSPAWQPVGVDTAQQLRGLDATDRRHAWVGGSQGGVWRTSDGGKTWQDVSPPGAEGLLFRDVEILGPRTVLALSIGEGDDSRIYRTTDGGRTWTPTFTNGDPAAFYDCTAMWPGGRRGIAMSDPVDGKFRIIETRDRGATWSVVDPAGMPDAIDPESSPPAEFGFAASGTCLVTAGRRDAFLATGGAGSRIFHSQDYGHTWTVRDSTIPAAPGGGTFSLDFRHPWKGLAVGGDLADDSVGTDMSAYSDNRGRSWTNGGDLGGYRSGVAWLARARETAVAVGPTGSDLTRDGGRHWRTFDGAAYDAVQCTPDGACWASGPKGAVARLRR